MGALSPLTAQPLGHITVEWDRDSYVLRLAGDIDDATVDAYQEPPFDASVIGVIDLTEVEFLSSSGVAFLIRQTQPLRDRGHLPAVRGLSARTQRVLQLTGAITMFQPVVQATRASCVSQRSA
jgi:anti-anti-sigma factor